MSDLERLRLSHAGRDAFELERPGDGAQRFVGRVLTSSPAVGKFMLVRPVSVTGTEAEGSTPTFTDLGSGSIPVLLLGPGVPATGSHVLVRNVDSRWVAKRRGTGGGGPITGGPLLGCTCPTPPATLIMTSIPCSDPRFNSCTIQWGPTPPALAPLSLPSHIYLSVETFVEPITGDTYHYMMTCFSSVFRIAPVYPSSIYAGGGPFLDSVIYFWTLGFPGNTCTPFLLSNGSPNPGIDPTCSVTISE